MNIQGIRQWLTPQPDQRLTAIHEAGHCTLANILAGYPGTRAVKIWPADPGSAENWWGVCDVLEGWGTWDAAMLWRDMLVGYGGPAASLRFESGPMTADNVRGHWTAVGGDEKHASELAYAVWPDEHAETVCDRAAQVALDLVSNDVVWAGIRAVADYVLTRREANATEIALLVHRFVPDPIPAPGLDWALSLIP